MEEPDAFQERLGSLSGMNVDIAHLRNIRIYLDALAEMVRAEMLVAKHADQALRAGRYEQSVFGSEEILTQVPALKQRTRTMATKVDENLANIATALTETARAVDRIAAIYASNDRRNRLTIAEVSQLLPRSRTRGDG